MWTHNYIDDQNRIANAISEFRRLRLFERRSRRISQKRTLEAFCPIYTLITGTGGRMRFDPYAIYYLFRPPVFFAGANPTINASMISSAELGRCAVKAVPSKPAVNPS